MTPDDTTPTPPAATPTLPPEVQEALYAAAKKINWRLNTTHYVDIVGIIRDELAPLWPRAALDVDAVLAKYVSDPRDDGTYTLSLNAEETTELRADLMRLIPRPAAVTDAAQQLAEELRQKCNKLTAEERASLMEFFWREYGATQPSADVERVAEEIAHKAEDHLEDFGIGYLVNTEGRSAIAAILRREWASLEARAAAKDVEIARHQEGTVIDLHGNRHLCSMPLALACAGFVQELEDTKRKLEHARGELRNSYSGEVIGARLRDYEAMKARAEAAERERDELRAEAETLLWNLAGCDTIASGHSKPGEFNTDMARPALHSVSKLRQERDELRAEIVRLERNLYTGDDDEKQALRAALADTMAKLGERDGELAVAKQEVERLTKVLNTSGAGCALVHENAYFIDQKLFIENVCKLLGIPLEDWRSALFSIESLRAQLAAARPIEIVENVAGNIERFTPTQEQVQGWFDELAVAKQEVERLKKKQPINTHVRLFDLVRFMRSELARANLITEEEYAWLCFESPMARGEGSPSPRRLEDYDDLRAQLATLEASERKAHYEREDARQSLEYCREQLAAAQADKERLDWLGANRHDQSIDGLMENVLNIYYDRHFASLRAAIDAARREGGAP